MTEDNDSDASAQRAYNKMAAKAIETPGEEFFRDHADKLDHSPAVETYLAATKLVTKVDKGNGRVDVTLSRDKTSETVHFTVRQWRSGSAATHLADRFWMAYDEDVPLQEGDWEVLRAAWEEQMNTRAADRHGDPYLL